MIFQALVLLGLGMKPQLRPHVTSDSWAFKQLREATKFSTSARRAEQVRADLGPLLRLKRAAGVLESLLDQ